MKLKDIGGSIPIVTKGILKLRFLDNNEQEKNLLIRYVYYAPKLTLCYLSPQQWSKKGPQKLNEKIVYSEETSGNVTILKLKDGTKTIARNTKNNIPILHTLPGFSSFNVQTKPTYSQLSSNPTNRTSPKDLDLQVDDHIHIYQHNVSTPDEALLQQWHNCLGFLPFKTVKHIVHSGLLDKQLANVKSTHFCPGCQYGKQSREAWKKQPNKHHIAKNFKDNCPGDLVCIDALSSTTVPGLVPQLHNCPTNKRFYFATIFVDIFGKLNYIYLHTSYNAENKLVVKSDFEHFASTSNITIWHYHCDNGVFANYAFWAACKASAQRITFYGGKAHHQNGLAEQHILNIIGLRLLHPIYGDLHWSLHQF